jgi:hypothetical protein
MVQERSDILGSAGAKIVDYVDRMAFRQEKFGQMRAYEASASGNKNVHCAARP